MKSAVYSASARATRIGRTCHGAASEDAGTGVRPAVVRSAKYAPHATTAAAIHDAHPRGSRGARTITHTSHRMSSATPLSFESSAASAQTAAMISPRAAGRSPGTNAPFACALATNARPQKMKSAASGSARPLTYVTALVCSGCSAHASAPASAHHPPFSPNQMRSSRSSASAASAWMSTLVKCQPGCGALCTAATSA